MDEQQRFLDLVGLQVGAHVDVSVCCLPQHPLFSLKAKGRQRPASAKYLMLCLRNCL